MAEYFHEGTLNISAKVLRTASFAKAEDAPEARAVFGGADISTSWGEDYGLKYYDKGYKSAMAQAEPLENFYQKHLAKHPGTSRAEYLAEKGLDPNTDFTQSKYVGQALLIPSDQLTDAKEALQRKILDLRNNMGNPDRARFADSYEKTLAALTDHIEGTNGEQSMRLTYEQSRDLMRCAKTGTFDPKDFDIDAAILADKTYILLNSLKAGSYSALLSCALKVAPEIVSLIKNAIDDGEISVEDLNQLGVDALSSSAIGFLRGTLISYISTAAEMGYLGEAMKGLSSTAVFSSGLSTLITLVWTISAQTINYQTGKITKNEYSTYVDRAIFIASASYGVGVAIQSLLPELPFLGYMIGSCVGSILGGIAFEIKEQFFMSLCVHNGWTLWGLVEQDYTLPREVAEKLGYQMMKVAEFNTCKMEVCKMEIIKFKKEMFDYEKLDISPMIRGIIGVRKVGYVSCH